jgi:hypothetical protein
MPVKAQNEYAPSERPARYLKRIAALTGARRFRGERYMLAVGRVSISSWVLSSSIFFRAAANLRVFR